MCRPEHEVSPCSFCPVGNSHGRSPDSPKALIPLAGAESNLGDPGCSPSNRARAGGHLIFCRDRCSCKRNKSISQPDANVLMPPYQAGTCLSGAASSFYPCSGAQFSIVASTPGFWKAPWTTGFLQWADSWPLSILKSVVKWNCCHLNICEDHRPYPDASAGRGQLNSHFSCSLWSVRNSYSFPPYFLKNRTKVCWNFKLDDNNNNIFLHKLNSLESAFSHFILFNHHNKSIGGQDNYLHFTGEKTEAERGCWLAQWH